VTCKKGENELKKKIASRDENLSGLMNFISFNLDNGVEVKSLLLSLDAAKFSQDVASVVPRR
jgi:hypothetical protein